MTEKVKRIDLFEVIKLLVVSITSIAGTQAINASGSQSFETKVAVLEEKVRSVETILPKMDEKLDTLLMSVARLKK